MTNNIYSDFYEWLLKKCNYDCKSIRKNNMKYLYKTSNKILEEIKEMRLDSDDIQYKLDSDFVGAVKEEYKYLIKYKDGTYNYYNRVFSWYSLIISMIKEIIKIRSG